MCRGHISYHYVEPSMNWKTCFKTAQVKDCWHLLKKSKLTYKISAAESSVTVELFQEFWKEIIQIGGKDLAKQLGRQKKKIKKMLQTNSCLLCKKKHSVIMTCRRFWLNFIMFYIWENYKKGWDLETWRSNLTFNGCFPLFKKK